MKKDIFREDLIKTYEETENICPHLAIPMSLVNYGFEKYDLPSYSLISIYYTDNVLYPLLKKEEAKMVTNAVVNKIINDPKFVTKVANEIEKKVRELENTIMKIERMDLVKCEIDELYGWHHLMQSLMQKLWGLVWVFIATDFPYDDLNNRMKVLLKNNKITSKKIVNIMAYYFQPEVAKLALYKYYFDILKEKSWQNIFKKYYWIHWSYDDGQELDRKLVKKDLLMADRLINNNKIKKKYFDLENKELVRLLGDIKTMSQSKASAKEKVNKTCFWMHRLMVLMAEKTSHKAVMLKYLLPTELNNLLNKKQKIDWGNVKKRMRKSIYLFDQSETVMVDTVAIEKLKITNAHKQDKKKSNSITGMVAYQGQAVGKALIIKGIKDISKYKNQKDFVLVSVNTSTEMMPIMRKAKAIVTDIGGITSHAAIIARELKIPCIVGTKVATNILKDNDIVKVDATHGKLFFQ